LRLISHAYTNADLQDGFEGSGWGALGRPGRAVHAPQSGRLADGCPDGWRTVERISSCLAETTVNAVISKRFAKRQPPARNRSP
jgi:hypothetical protein